MRSTAGLDRWTVPLLSVLFVPLWASGFIAGKIATQHMEVPTVLLWRFVIAAVAMGAVAVLTRPALPRGSAWAHLAVTALLLQVGQFSAVYSGLANGVPAGLSSLILGMAPLLVGLLTPLLLSTKLGPAPVFGLVIGAAGVYVVLSDELGASVGGIGGSVVFPVLGMLSLTAGTLYQKKFNEDTPVVTTVIVQMLTSLVVTVVAMPFLGAAWLPTDTGGWAAVGWLGVFNSAGAFALMFLLLRMRSTVHVSSLLNLVPATTALVAVPVLGEALTVQAVVGLGIALVGMYVGLGLVRRRRRREPEPVSG
ncbi:DMT family transporter [Pseudonocardia sp. KRD291]|uniref:DMT family transporter n=1 Tax=Pseudonocardia sp. KRD291 TaxID=2792007 RepID=UPI001C4A2BBE|nr:DMT family transporter [Pseudonocardia sp. KRD291]MBW0103210.1 DMT family transporter [Pseudonocardia sp. KRD291]